jgi:hypothetical protein
MSPGSRLVRRPGHRERRAAASRRCCCAHCGPEATTCATGRGPGRDGARAPVWPAQPVAPPWSGRHVSALPSSETGGCRSGCIIASCDLGVRTSACATRTDQPRRYRRPVGAPPQRSPSHAAPTPQPIPFARPNPSEHAPTAWRTVPQISAVPAHGGVDAQARRRQQPDPRRPAIPRSRRSTDHCLIKAGGRPLANWLHAQTRSTEPIDESS